MIETDDRVHDPGGEALTSEPARPRKLSWLTAAAAALVLVAGATIVVRHGLLGSESGSATPSASPGVTTAAMTQSSLTGLADLAEIQPVPGSGAVRYLKLTAWLPGGNLS